MDRPHAGDSEPGVACDEVSENYLYQAADPSQYVILYYLFEVFLNTQATKEQQ